MHYLDYYNNPIGTYLLLSQIFRWGLEMLSNLSKVAQLARGWARI